MKIVIAPDSFKGSIRSNDVCRITAASFREVNPDAEIIEIPLADGGEGTVDVMISALNGRKVPIEVKGPFGKTIEAYYGIIDNGSTAVMEMASASGIELVAKEDLNPMKATTYGTGEMILNAVMKGVKNIIIGIGGSATVDGGCGMAQALGYRLLNADGTEVGPGGAGVANIAEIEIDEDRLQLLRSVNIMVASDVSNPLTGPNGAAAVFAPQKGATGFMVPILEDALKKLAEIWEKNGYIEGEQPGDGAAGGLGAGLRAFCGGTLTPGAELICNALNFSERIEGADLLITGEGKTDIQTLSGKLCCTVAKFAKEKQIPVLLISGALELRDELYDIFDYAFSISSGQTSLDELLNDAEQNLAFITKNIAKLIKNKK